MTTPLLPLIGASDGPRVTVNDLVNRPKVIPRRILSLLDSQFIIDDIFRDGGSNDSGVVMYEESTPLFADIADAADKTEFGEYRITTTSTGQVKVAISMHKGLSLVISETMRRRNRLDLVNRDLTMLTNTLVRTFDKAFRDAMNLNTNIPTIAASASWNLTTTNIHRDVLGAIFAVTEAAAGQQTDDFLGFSPDTIVMSAAKAQDVLGNDSVKAFFDNSGDRAEDKPYYRGRLPQRVAGLVPMISRTWPVDKVWVGEAKTVGFRSDERPLRTTPLYAHQPTETWRADVSRITAVGVDQPKSGIFITGVDL